jgi:hypothetical protein
MKSTLTIDGRDGLVPGQPASKPRRSGPPAHARRVRLPIGKDWTEARREGVNLHRWWFEILAGVERPEPFTWEELSTWQ